MFFTSFFFFSSATLKKLNRRGEEKKKSKRSARLGQKKEKVERLIFFFNTCKVVIFNYVLLALIPCQIWLYFFNHFPVCLWDSILGLSVWNWWRTMKNRVTRNLLAIDSRVDNLWKVTWEAHVGVEESSARMHLATWPTREMTCEMHCQFVLVCFPHFFTHTIKAHITHEIVKRISKRKH